MKAVPIKSSNFREDVSRLFSYLFKKHGFTFVPVANDFAGNIVIAQSDNLRFRFIHDRGYYFLDINNTLGSNKWVGFYKVLDHLKKSGKIEINYKCSNKIKTISKLLSQCLSAIEQSEFHRENPDNSVHHPYRPVHSRH